jgi:hypothetical protein
MNAFSFRTRFEPHADHCSTRIREDGGLPEVWFGVQIVCREGFLSGAIEHIEHVYD